MYARVARYEVPPERIEDAIRSFTEAGRELEELEGLDHGYVLVDHEDGSLMTVTLWQSRAALESSETRASLLRQGAVRAADGAVQSVQQFEVAVEMRGAATSRATAS